MDETIKRHSPKFQGLHELIDRGVTSDNESCQSNFGETLFTVRTLLNISGIVMNRFHSLMDDKVKCYTRRDLLEKA